MSGSQAKSDEPAGPVRPLPVSGYGYDAANRLVRIQGVASTRWRYWLGDQVANEAHAGQTCTLRLSWLQAGGRPLVETADGIVSRRLLLAGDGAGSTVFEAGVENRLRSYAPHGYRDAADGTHAEPAFQGERFDAESGCYLLGAGHHRPYSPTLGLFLAPDRWAPFDRGGLNALSFCAGDPVNRHDPSGHFWKWVVAGIGIVLGVAAVIASAGTAAGAVGVVLSGGLGALNASGAAAIAGVTLGVASVGVEAASLTAMAKGDDETAGILGWVGLGLGVAGLAPALGKAAMKGAGRLADRMSRFSGRVARRRPPAGGGSAATGRLGPPGGSSPAFNRRGGRLWRTDPTGGQFNVRVTSAPGPKKWARTAGVRPNRFSAPAQRPTSLDFASKRPRPYTHYEGPPVPASALDEPIQVTPDYPHVRFNDAVDTQRYRPVAYSSRYIRDSRVNLPAPAEDVAFLMASSDPADYYIKVALEMKTP